MAVVSPPAWIQAGEYPAHTDRLVPASIVQDEGVVQVGDLEVAASSTPGMSVTVSAGRAWIRDASPGATENKGLYNFVNDGPETLSVEDSHATLDRIDRVVARVKDSDVSGAEDEALLEVITGTPASSPAAPALPASSLSLKEISVVHNATSVTGANLTGTPPRAKLHSSMIDSVAVVTSSTRPTGADRVTGMQIFETDTKRSWQWNGSEWQFRGGKGPRAFIGRSGTWTMGTNRVRIDPLTPATGINFETAYFTYVPESSGAPGDRIRVKQSGLYVLEMAVDIRNTNTDFFVLLRTVISGGTGLPSGMIQYPSLSQQYTRGRSQPISTRTLYLTAGTEMSYESEAYESNTTVFNFWASATLIG